MFIKWEYKGDMGHEDIFIFDDDKIMHQHFMRGSSWWYNAIQLYRSNNYTEDYIAKQLVLMAVYYAKKQNVTVKTVQVWQNECLAGFTVNGWAQLKRLRDDEFDKLFTLL